MTNDQREMFHDVAARASALGLTTAPECKPITAKKRNVRHKPRRRGANLGVVEVNGNRYVVEYRPGEGLVVRRFYRKARHVLTLIDLVDVALGQQILSTGNRGRNYE